MARIYNVSDGTAWVQRAYSKKYLHFLPESAILYTERATGGKSGEPQGSTYIENCRPPGHHVFVVLRRFSAFLDHKTWIQ